MVGSDPRNGWGRHLEISLNIGVLTLVYRNTSYRDVNISGIVNRFLLKPGPRVQYFSLQDTVVNVAIIFRTDTSGHPLKGPAVAERRTRAS